MHSFRSKEDHVIRISKSVFVTNFPDSFGSRDLWNLCEAYGKVVDAFIPNRKSKAVGRFHLHANAVRYERSNKPPPSVRFPLPQIHKQSGSYATAVKDFNSPPVISSPVSSSPALVLDDTCVNADDLSRHVMGRVKDLNSIPNLLTKNEKTKRKLLQHTGANSWFYDL
ncbi:RNA-directed DNA polymerase, eukaryota [Tanacetum coccineum]